jgi:hypothetical protein
MLPPKEQLTICFAHAAYRMQDRFALRNNGIRSIEVRDRVLHGPSLGGSDLGHDGGHGVVTIDVAARFFPWGAAVLEGGRHDQRCAERPVAGEADVAAEPDDGGLAGAAGLGELMDAHLRGRRRLREEPLGHARLGWGEVAAQGSDARDQLLGRGLRNLERIRHR